MAQGQNLNPYKIALDILSRRDHTRFELEQKLKRKKFSASTVSDVLEKLERNNLVNDRKFAQLYVASVLRQKAVGPHWIKNKLRQKNISADIINEVISEGFDDHDRQAVANQAAVIWQKTHVKYQNDRVRLMRFLQSRGFDQVTALEAIKAVVHQQ